MYMPRTRIMGAGNAGASSMIRLGGPTIGTKGQGLVSSVGRRVELNVNRSYGNNRDMVFRINQLGGVGRGRSIFRIA